MSWHKPHNISGTVHCGERIDELRSLYRELIGSDDVFVIGHFTGAVSICGHSSLVTFITTGFEVHDAYFHVQGPRATWLDFAACLEEMLTFNNVPYSLGVHNVTANAQRADNTVCGR